MSDLSAPPPVTAVSGPVPLPQATGLGDPVPLPPETADHLRRAAWMDEAGRSATGFEVVDVVELGRCRSLLITAPANQRERWYSIPLGDEGEPLDGPCATMDALVVDGMRERHRIRTRHGGLVTFHGDPPPFDTAVAFDGGWSSNALSMMRLGGELHVHKRYRVLSSGMHEPEVLRRMSGTRCLPDATGGYDYLSPSGERFPLGVAYRYVEGEPLEELLRTNLRSLWNRGDGAVHAQVRLLEPLLRAVGSLIHRLHQSLATAIPPGEPRPGMARTSHLAAVTRYLMSDETHPVTVRQSLADALDRAATAMPAGSPRSGPCHGDLHLSHLVCRPAPDGAWTARAIDVSPVAVDPHDPEFADQSPWQDLVAVQRSLESFAAHEAAVEAARVLGVHRREICKAAVSDALHADRDAAQQVRQHLYGMADAWSGLVMRVILDHYRPGATNVTGHPWWRALYVRRLLHELAYNYAHDRHYQVDMDLRRVPAVLT
ncbi:phosphotransferase [Nonomuraea sp. NPDC050153]|uniref:phosphotransferase n=1 Tax=Nonomuraea sp. NPDC050153 TaxID=3364359 RepID=UPI00379128C0